MRTLSRGNLAMAMLLAGTLACGSAFADKPEGVGGGKPGKSAKQGHKQDARGNGNREADRQGERRDDERRGARGEAYFDDHHRAVMHTYYEDRFRSGRCPPGLAKKHNGCLPPGQAKKWTLGRPLPHDVIFYDLPPQVVVQLGTPPAGHRFVRVASDILLIAIGSGMVIDAIEDLSRQ
jgi:Ni/Co efflux regulator RcnB